MNKYLVLAFMCLFFCLTANLHSKNNQTFTIRTSGEFQTLDPSQINTNPSARVHMSLFEGLTSYDPKTAAPIPGIAKSWKANRDCTVFTFYLRQAQWSDGTPITAQTFVDSWLRFLNPDSASKYAWMMSILVKGADEYNSNKAPRTAVKIRALNKRTFQVCLKKPAAYFPELTSHFAFSIVPTHIIKKHGSNWTKPNNFVCNGPFILSSIENNKLTVIKNEKYWDKSKVALDKIIYIDGENTSFFSKPEYDWEDNISFEEFTGNSNNKLFKKSPLIMTYYYIFNTRNKPFNDKRVRKAFSMTINRETINNQINKRLKTISIPTYSFNPPFPTYKSVESEKENIAKAKLLLKQAGYPNGKGIKPIKLLYNSQTEHKEIAEYIKSNWEKHLGVKVVLIEKSWKRYLQDRQNGSFDIARAGWAGDFRDPMTFLELFISQNPNNSAGFTNRSYDSLIKQAAKTINQHRRYSLYNKAENILINQQQILIPIYYYTTAVTA